MCLICLCNYLLFLIPVTQDREIAVVSEIHTRASRERLAREEANGPSPALATRFARLLRFSNGDIYTMKIRPFFVEVLL